MYEDIARIAGKFNIEPVNIYKCRYYYVLNCTKGAYSLSVARPKPARINEIHNVKECLADYGIYNIDTYCLNNEGLPYCEDEGKIYVATRFFGSNELDFMNNDQVICALNDIGRVHKGLRLMSDEMLSVAGENNPVMTMYKSMGTSLERIRKLIIRKGNRYWDKESIIKFCNIIDRSFETVHKLENMNYGNSATYCHCRLKEGNIIYKKGRTYIIDWDNMKYLSYIEDIAFFINRYIRKNCFYSHIHNIHYMNKEEVLKRYSRYTSISQCEYDILNTVLEYPHRFVSTMEEFFKTSKNFVPSGIKNKLDEVLVQEDFVKKYINMNL